MKMLLTLAKKGKVGKDLETMSQDDFEDVIKKEALSKADVKEAKDIYTKEKKKS